MARRSLALLASLLLTLGWFPTLAAADTVQELTACPSDASTAFTDIAGNTHERAIACLVAFAITEGRTATTYAPRESVTRAQMASFLVRALDSQGVTLADPGAAPFTDIAGSPHESAIRRLHAAGIAQGVDASTYAPSRAVGRAQMATFLVRATEAALGRSLPTPSSRPFADVTSGPHEVNVGKAFRAGLTSGVREGEYAPSQDVRRDQMASFLARTISFIDAELQPGPLEVTITAPTQGAEVATVDGLLRIVGEVAGTTAPLDRATVAIDGEQVYDGRVFTDADGSWNVPLIPPAEGSYDAEVTLVATDGAQGSDGVGFTVTSVLEGLEEEQLSPLVVELDDDTLAATTVTGDPPTSLTSTVDELPFTAGDVLVAGVSPTTPEGLLVHAVVIDGAPGAWDVTVELASLEDAFLQVEATIVTQVEAEDAAAQFAPSSADGLPAQIASDDGTCIDVPLPDQSVSLTSNEPDESATIALSDTAFRTCVELEFVLDITYSGFWDPFGRLEEFRIGSAASQSFGTDIELEGELGLFERTIADPPRTPLKTIVIPLKIPIVITSDLDVKIEASGGVSGAISTRFDSSVGYRAGLSYTAAAGWSDTSQLPTTANLDFPTLTGTVDAKLQAKAGIRTRLYNAVGPELTAGLGPKMATSVDSSGDASFTFSLDGDIAGKVAGPEVLSRFIPEYEVTIAEFSRKIYTIGVDAALTILAPDDGAQLPCCEVELVAQADGEVQWTRDGATLLGTGSPLRANLPLGEHTITASLVDDPSIRDEITITVLASDGAFTVPTLIGAGSSATALDLATAMATSPDRLLEAEWVELPDVGAPHGIGVGAPGQSTGDGRVGIMTTGAAALAPTPNEGTGEGADLGSGPIRGDSAFDVSILRVRYDVPANANCLRFDFRFLSEEFPDFIGSEFNDAFVAELGSSTWSAQGSELTAPGNFASDPTGRPITVNDLNTLELDASNASGTTYDGATRLLQAATPIQPGAQDIFLTIFDQGDHVFDSAVFINRLRTVTVSDASQCEPRASEVIGQ